jgi:hypothetical protein
MEIEHKRAARATSVFFMLIEKKIGLNMNTQKSDLI